DAAGRAGCAGGAGRAHGAEPSAGGGVGSGPGAGELPRPDDVWARADGLVGDGRGAASRGDAGAVHGEAVAPTAFLSAPPAGGCAGGGAPAVGKPGSCDVRVVQQPGEADGGGGAA